MSDVGQQLEFNLESLFLDLGAIMGVKATLFAAKLQAEIEIMRIQGLAEDTIFTVLEQDALTGGRIFGEFENAVKSTIFGGIQSASVLGEQEVFKAAGIDVNFEKWVTMSGAPCPDCAGRAGRVEPRAVWQAIGIEGSGWSVCRDHCMCRREPVGLDVPDSVDLRELNE